MDRPEALVERLGLPDGDLPSLPLALTHPSWVHEHPDEADGHNERLEFLGDAVVNLALAEALYRRHPDDDEGVLSARRAAIVSTTGLARMAARIGVGEAVRFGQGEARGGGRRRPHLLAAALEAIAGGLFVDRGWPVARDWVQGLAAAEIDAAQAPASLKSPKSRLQEHTQHAGGRRPEYVILAAEGPAHEREFTVEVRLDGERLGTGRGPSRRAAETVAADAALRNLAERAATPDPSDGSEPAGEPS